MNRFTWILVASVCAISASGCGLVLDTQAREGRNTDAGTGGSDLGLVDCVSASQCDDGNVCNGPEECLDGFCVGSDFVLTCDDGVSCTVDQCDPVFGCQSLPNDSLCDSGFCDPLLDCQDVRACVDPSDCGPANACAGLFDCVQNLCVRRPAIQCPRINQCLSGGCFDGGCVYVPNSALCNANPDSCAVSECQPNGTCSDPVPQDELCDDQLGCTIDSCSSSGQTGVPRCQHVPNDRFCDDGVDCTQDFCDPSDPSAQFLGEGCAIRLDDSVCRSVSSDLECVAPICLPTGCDDGVEVLPCIEGGVCDVTSGFCEFSEGCGPANDCVDYGSPCAPAVCLQNQCLTATIDPCLVNVPLGFTGFCDISLDIPRCDIRPLISIITLPPLLP